MAKRKRRKEKKLPVLLLQDHPYLGQEGTVVLVKPGYYRFLVAQKMAVLATKEKITTELKPKLLTEKLEQRKKTAKELKEKIEKLNLLFYLTPAKEGKVFGSVTKEKIVKALKEKGISLSKSQINLASKITQPGKYQIEVNLGYGVSVNLEIEVKLK